MNLQSLGTNTSKAKKFFNNVCFWLFFIAIFLLTGVVLFAIYLYKIDLIHLIDFRSLLYNEQNVFSPELLWSSVEAVATLIGTLAAILIGIFTIKMSKRLQEIEEQQNQLYTEPHALVDNISIQSATFEISEQNKIKGLQNCNYPFYNNKNDKLDFAPSSLIVLEFINTSEAFARLRFDNAIFRNGDTIVASFDMSTFGTHPNHIMLPKENIRENAKIGLFINNQILSQLRGTTLTISCFLDNNFKHCFRETQSYLISDITDEIVSFYPQDFRNNTYEKIK